jgi:dihydrofolate reductase
MPKLLVFNSITLDGYFTGENGDLSWAHTRTAGDKEWSEFIGENAKSEGLLLFGRVTYQMMAGYWPTPQAMQSEPVVAQHINAAPKVVFSRTLDKATWGNTRIVREDPVSEIRRLKEAPGADLVIMGSGTLVAPLAEAGLIDEYQLVLVPVALGQGRSLFDGVKRMLTLQPTRTRTFRNGNILLCYETKQQAGTAEDRRVTSAARFSTA